MESKVPFWLAKVAYPNGCGNLAAFPSEKRPETQQEVRGIFN